MADIDDHFYERADAHINLSNEQLKKTTRGKVSSSMMYGVARFNAWVAACGWKSAAEMQEAKAQTLAYFVDDYRKMLDENLQDYIDNFDSYMQTDSQQKK